MADPEPSLSSPTEADLDSIEAEVRALPPKAGAFLMFTGALGGLCVPGLPGVGIVILGGLVVVPESPMVRGADRWLKTHAPVLRGEALRFVHRFFHDLERRFPSRKA